MSTIRKEIHHDIVPAIGKTVAAITTDTTTAGAIIDTQGYGAVEFILIMGSRTDGTYTPLIEEGDDSGLSDAAAVADANLFGTEAAAALSASNTVKSIGYRVGKYRYVRLSIVSTSVTSGATLGAVAIKTNADQLPTS